MILVIRINLLGDGLRDALDPRMRYEQGWSPEMIRAELASETAWTEQRCTAHGCNGRMVTPRPSLALSRR